VIASLAFQGTLAKNEQGHAVALSAVASLTVAVIAWLIWVPVGRAAAVPGAPFAVVLAADLLGSIFVGGLVGNVIGLLPLRFLSVGTLMAWSRAAWAATFGIAVFGLVEVELRPQSTSAHPGSAPVITAVLLFVLFGGSSAGMRWYFSRRERQRREAEKTEREEVRAEGRPAPAASSPAPAAAPVRPGAPRSAAATSSVAAPPAPSGPAAPRHVGFARALQAGRPRPPRAVPAAEWAAHLAGPHPRPGDRHVI
jgi:hypothetical protein